MKKNAVKVKKRAKGKGTEGASEEKGTLKESTMQIDLYLKSSDFSQRNFHGFRKTSSE
jgi:hypothetical protein